MLVPLPHPQVWQGKQPCIPDNTGAGFFKKKTNPLEACNLSSNCVVFQRNRLFTGVRDEKFFLDQLPRKMLRLLPALKDKRVVLASQSPRRQEILSLLNIQFDVIPSTFPETLDKSKYSPVSPALLPLPPTGGPTFCPNCAGRVCCRKCTAKSFGGSHQACRVSN